MANLNLNGEYIVNNFLQDHRVFMMSCIAALTFGGNWKINNKSHTEELKSGDSIYIKPNVPHNFRNKGKLMVLRIAGRIAGDAQRELSSLDKNDAHRAISEVSMWFDPLEKTNA